jgi:hypothetical protein
VIESADELPAWLQVTLAAAPNGLDLTNLRAALWEQLDDRVRRSPEALRFGADLTRALTKLRKERKVARHRGGIWTAAGSSANHLLFELPGEAPNFD